MGRTASALVVAALCLLAGCGGFGGQDQSADEVTDTPAPVPEVPQDPAEGVSERGIDAGTVAANHRAALENRSYTSSTRIRWRGENGSRRVDATVHRVAAGAERFRVTSEYARPRGTQNATGYELWTDENRTVLRVVHDDGSDEYRRIHPDRTLDYPRERLITAFFSRLEPGSVTQTTDGHTVVRGRVEALDELRGLARFRDETNATMSARVAPDGHVDRLALGFEATVEGRPVDARVTIEFTRVGETTVDPPAWAENASGRSATPTPLP